MSKFKIFKPKKSKLKNFELQKRYIPQNKVENIYNSVSEKIFAKKKFFWNFSDFRDMLEDPLKFSMFNFSKISKKKSKNSFTGFYQTLKGTKSWILVNLAQTLWKWQTISDRPGHNAPPPVGIGLTLFQAGSGITLPGGGGPLWPRFSKYLKNCPK